MAYRVEVRPKAAAQLSELPEQVQRKVVAVLIELGQNPYSGRTTALEGGLKGYRRARIGDHRIICYLEDETLQVAAVGSRATIYNQMLRTTED